MESIDNKIAEVKKQLIGPIEDKKIRRFKKELLETYWSTVGQIQLRHGQYETDSLAQKYIEHFCSTSDEYYPEHKENKLKGLFVFGNTGTGKTFNFKIYEMIYTKLSPEVGGRKFSPLSYINNDTFMVAHVDEIKKGAKSLGEDYIKRLSSVRNLVIDEFGGGENEEINDYGTKSNPIIEVINARYRSMRDNLLITHFTSNLTKEEIYKKYGERIYDRLREMCIWLPFEGESKRK